MNSNYDMCYYHTNTDNGIASNTNNTDNNTTNNIH